MDRDSLRELQQMWHAHVVMGLDPDGEQFQTLKPLPCWFGENVPGIDPCEGRIEGAHWIKRQRVGRVMAYALEGGADVNEAEETVQLAEWDPRNGIPSCSKHHRRFDGHRVDATNELVIWRHEVPAHVEAFAADYGLETALEEKHPLIGRDLPDVSL